MYWRESSDFKLHMLKLNLHLSGVYRCRRVSIWLIVSCETTKRKLPVRSENLQILTISHKKLTAKKLSFKTNGKKFTITIDS